MRTVLLLTVAALALPLSTACHRQAARTDLVATDTAGQLLHQRIWLDQEPKGPTDRFHVLVFDRQRTGVYQDRTVWKGAFEMFRYEAEGGRLTLRLPGSKKTIKTGFRIERARRGDADVKLTLDDVAAGPTVYWGYRFEGGDADAWLDARFGEP